MGGTGAADAWFPSHFRRTAGTAGNLTLYCLPYAGGSAALFRPWLNAPPAGLSIVAIQLPGRRERLHEPPTTSARAMAERLGQALLPRLDGPFALFGISMGALIAFELAHWLGRRAVVPAHLFVASYPSPRRTLARQPVHGAPDEVVVKALRELGVTPPEILADKEMLELLLPTIRADLAVTETYAYADRGRLPVPITVFRGITDVHLPPDAADEWRWETSGGFAVATADSGHFLLPEHGEQILQRIAITLVP